MRSSRMFLLVILCISFFAILLAVSRTVSAQGSGRLQARAQIRSTIDPSDFGTSSASARGDVLFVQDGAQQSLIMKLKNLPESDLQINLSTNSFFDNTNSPAVLIAPLDRTDRRQWNWRRKLVGTNGAPPEFQIYGITNLSDLSDLRCLVLGTPGFTNVVGGSNVITCTQTVTNGIIVETCFTNNEGGVTDIFINAFSWAPVPPIVGNTRVFSFNEKIKLARPNIPPSPKATGDMRISYKGPTGDSLIDIHVSNLSRGQSYQLWVSDGGTNVASGKFQLTANGAGGRYLRDTKRGDPLPLQATSTAILTDRVFTIQDASGAVHLFGTLP
jgi:hypothetical protein